jgi:hypothetical protein
MTFDDAWPEDLEGRPDCEISLQNFVSSFIIANSKRCGHDQFAALCDATNAGHTAEAARLITEIARDSGCQPGATP